MEERDLAIPFEVKDINENVFKKLAKKTQVLIKKLVIRII